MLSFRVQDRDCEELGELLGRRGIALRAGLHCAPLAHRTAGTLESGTLRASVSAFTLPEEIGRALATWPKLLLLDAPAAGMNSPEKKELVNTIRKIRDTYHLAVLLVEHDMELVMGISENITVINFGRPIACGTAEEIQSNNDVIEAYLGRSDDE